MATVSLFAGSGGVFPARAAGNFNFFAAREPDVLTVTDVTPEGRAWPEATPAKPVYYEAMSFGAKNFRGLHGDPAPKSKTMLDLIVKTMAKQGLLPAQEKNTATLFLSISWGYSSGGLSALGFLGGDKLDLMWETENLPFLSPNVLRRGLRSQVADKVMSAAQGDLYIASIKAYDLKAIDAGTETLLWHTRIACPATGLSMAGTLPVMIVAAGPFIGRETKVPVWRDAADLKKTDIQIGDPRVMDHPNAIERADRVPPSSSTPPTK